MVPQNAVRISYNHLGYTIEASGALGPCTILAIVAIWAATKTVAV